MKSNLKICEIFFCAVLKVGLLKTTTFSLRKEAFEITVINLRDRERGDKSKDSRLPGHPL